MFEQFPYTDMHQLNLDWIVKIAKDFLDQYTHIQDTITQGLEDLDQKAQDLEQLLQTWYDQHSQDIADQLADALNDLNQWYIEHQDYLNQYLQDSIAEFNASADEKARQTIASIPDDYTALSNRVVETIDAVRLSDINVITDMTPGYIEYTDINIVHPSANWECAKIEVAPGLKCKVKGSGGSSQQLWMVFDASGNSLIYSGDTTRITDYQEFTIPPEGKYLVLNQNITESSLYPFSAIMGYSNAPGDHLAKFTINNRDVSQYTSSSGASDWYWFTAHQYPAGYIDHVVLYGTANSVGRNAYVAVYDITEGKCVFSSDGVIANETRVVIPVNAYFEHKFYLCARLPYLAHAKVGGNINYADMWQFAPPEGEGSVFNITWEATPDNYRFAVECWYNTDFDRRLLESKITPTKVFIAGDSITAGYPYIAGLTNQLANPGLRWGEQLKRKYGFITDYGAETGGGWIYLPNPTSRNAITITDNTNFANYDCAVYAFGTNDYGANIPLGNLTDLYPTNNTVCGAMNYIINKIYTDNPGIVLIISSPINRGDKGSFSTNYGYGTANTQGYTLLDLLNKMKELCTTNGVCFIDNSNSPFNKYAMTRLMFDSLHPSIKGYHVMGSMMSERVAQFMTPYLREPDAIG